MGVVEVHTWGSTVDDIDHPDLLAINLLPRAGVKWEFVTKTAQEFRRLLKKDGCRPWIKTSGEIGLHVMVPVDHSRSWTEAKKWTVDVAKEVAGDDSRYTLHTRDKRHGKLLL